MKNRTPLHPRHEYHYAWKCRQYTKINHRSQSRRRSKENKQKQNKSRQSHHQVENKWENKPESDTDQQWTV